MNILRTIFKSDKDLLNENSKMRRSKKQVESDYTELKDKYIELLEWKSEQFDLYINYQNQCETLMIEKRDLKKQLAEMNEKCHSLTESNEELTKQIEKMERKIKRMEKQDRVAKNS